MMIQLIYVSRAVTPFTREQLLDLLQLSRTNNGASDITGMLVYHHASFMQAIEGEEAAVMQLFEKIKRDSRHTDVAIVSTGQIRRRSFGSWTMGFFNADESSSTELPGFDDFFGESFSQHLFASLPSLSRKLLLSFRRGQWRQKVEEESAVPS